MGKKKPEINMETFDLDNQVFRQKTETHAVFTLGKTEKLAMAEEAGQLQQDAFDLEDKVKRFKKEQDETIKGLRTDVSKLLQRIHKGEEERKVECLAEYDYTNYKIRYINMQTGEIVKETDMDEFTMNNIPPELNPDQTSFENNPTVTNEQKAEAIDGTKGPETIKAAEARGKEAGVEVAPIAEVPIPEPVAVAPVQPVTTPMPAPVAPVQPAAAQTVQVAPIVQPVQPGVAQAMASPVPQPIAPAGSFDQAFN